MHKFLDKFFLALILLSIPVSTGAVAHSGADQEEKPTGLE
jgi:hypothetical protein